LKTSYVIENLTDLKACIDGQSTPQFPEGYKVNIYSDTGGLRLLVVDSENDLLTEFEISVNGATLLTDLLTDEGLNVEKM